MKKLRILGLLSTFLLQTASANSCDFLAPNPQPDWINGESQIQGYYVGIGVSGKSRKGSDFQIKKSAQDAKRDLSENIQVTIKSKFLISQTIKSTGSSDELSEQQAETLTLTTSLATLKNIITDEIWLDRKSCLVWTRVKVKKSTVQKEAHKQLQLAKINAVQALLKTIDTETSSTKNELHKIELAEKKFNYIDFSALPKEQPETLQLQINQIKGILQSNFANTKSAEKLFSDAGMLQSKAKNEVSNKKQLMAKALQNYNNILIQYPFGFDENDWSEKAAFEIASLEIQRENSCAAKNAIEKIINLSNSERWRVKAKRMRRKARCNANDQLTYNFRNAFDAKKVSVFCSYKLTRTFRWKNVCEKIITHLNSHGALAKSVKTLTGNNADFLIHVEATGTVETRITATKKEYQFKGDITTRVNHQATLFLDDQYSGIGGWNPVSEKMAMEVLGIHVFKRFIKNLNKQLEG